MSVMSPSFANGSSLEIRIGNTIVAYATNLSFSDDVSVAAVGGIGSYSYDTLEPTSYASRGGFTITRYSKDALNAITASGALTQSKGGSSSGAAKRTGEKQSLFGGDGNSMLTKNSFNPTNLLSSTTFDIDVYQRNASDNSDMTLVFRCLTCRLTSYSISFTPGTLVAEQIGFICLQVEDSQVSAINNA